MYARARHLPPIPRTALVQGLSPARFRSKVRSTTQQKSTVARRCISANAIHFPSYIELDIRYFAIRYTVFNAAVTAASLRSPKPRFRSVQRYCAHRNPDFALCSGTALTETQVSLCAAVLRSPKPKFRSVQRCCAHRNPGFALCSGTALTET